MRAAKPVAPAKVAPAKVARPVVRAAATYELPTERTWPSEDIREYSLLLYGPPGIGKTTFFASFPEALFLLTEPGKPSGAYVFNESGGGITDWRVMRAAVELLEKDKSRYKNVVIDTLDEGYEMCQRYVCKAAGVEHPHDANDYGKTWDKVTREFKDVFARIRRTGRGLYLTSHAKEGVVQPATGKEYTKIGPSVTGKAGAKVLAMVDFIFFVDYYIVGGTTKRLVCTSGTELVVGKQRPIGRGAVQLPKYIALPDDPAKDYEMFASAFRGEAKGVEPDAVKASKMSSRAASGELEAQQKAKVQRALAAKEKGGRAGG